jgi:nitrile hydratase
MTQRFAVGDSVRTRPSNPEGHTRLPAYLCDRRGTIERVHGLLPLADDRARGAASRGARETLYTVVFNGREIWRERSDETLSVAADLFDSYLREDVR